MKRDNTIFLAPIFSNVIKSSSDKVRAVNSSKKEGF